MGFDATTSSAIAALVVACLALLIALAQVIQQYLITGQLIRLCDGVVFGPLPGKGRRVWELSQFRFRVVYSIPQISLDTSLWPERSPHVRSYAIGEAELPELNKASKAKDSDEETREGRSLNSPRTPPGRGWRGKFPSLQRLSKAISKHSSSHRRVGEAAWVSFCRAIEEPCGGSIRLDLVEHDADRCPSDLISAPMQVSMRDIIIMGLMAGMEVTSCSFKTKSVSMQGHVGTITSSSHPVLGPILHFTPRHGDKLFFGAFGVPKVNGRGSVESRWMARTWNVCQVGRRYYHSETRRTARRLDARWIHVHGGKGHGEILIATEEPMRLREFLRHKKFRPGEDSQQGTAQESTSGVPLCHGEGSDEFPKRYHQDGDWRIREPYEKESQMKVGNEQKPRASIEAVTKGKAPEAPASETRLSPEPKSTPDIDRQPTVQDGDEENISSAGSSPLGSIFEESTKIMGPEMEERLETAKALQAERGAKAREMEKDKLLVEDSVKRRALPPISKEGRLLLTLEPHNPDPDEENNPDPHEKTESPVEPTTEEEEAHKREKERARLRKERDSERAERNKARNRAVTLKDVDLYWISQMNIFQGFWATPWAAYRFMPLQTALVGAVTVILEALLGFLDSTSLIYTEQSYASMASFRQTARFMFRGATTYPAYALNARGGVIASGTYTGVHIPQFKIAIPAVELLYSYDWQVEPSVRDPGRFCEELNVELMRLDSWLSYVGRCPEISDGRHKLLHQTPELIVEIFDDFHLDFQNTDLSASEGGLQDIQGLAANVMDFLLDEELSEAEQLYVLIALLRTVKACQCILAGSSTSEMRDILLNDVQVHLV